MKTKGNNNKSAGSKGSEVSVGLDDADVTATAGGAKAPIFGFSVDSIGRSHATHLIPHHVRNVLCQFNANLTGNGTEHGIPWFDADSVALTGIVDAVDRTVASELSVTVADAESYEINPQASQFSEYADVPLNNYSSTRYAFWKYDPAAAELDPSIQLEPQIVAIDAFSQLFAESFDFHFQFLGTLDDEYHRLRSLGPLGMFNEASVNECWHNLYHYWRNEVYQTYLATNLVSLPDDKLRGQWTIRDVLDEIVLMMAPTGTELRSDIRLSAKGVMKAKSGASLGIYEDPAYQDNDGNPRFYMPQTFVNTFDVQVGGITQNLLSSTIDPGAFGDAGSVDNVSTGVASGSVIPSQGTVTEVNSATSMGYFPRLPAVPTSVQGVLANIADPANAGLLTVGNQYNHIVSIPTPEILLTTGGNGPLLANIGSANAGDYAAAQQEASDSGARFSLVGGSMYWRGYNLNLVELIELGRYIGRSLEAEVGDLLLPMFGEVGSLDMLMMQPRGLSAREHDKLFNIYESNYAFNENPARTYTAAHMGPADIVIPNRSLMLEGVSVDTVRGGTEYTVRELYWTPQRLSPTEVQGIMDYYFPGVVLTDTLAGDISFSSEMAGDITLGADGLLTPELVVRTLSTVGSMQTKVEKNVIMPAGLAAPEAAYASGVGPGAVELIEEYLMDSLGPSMTFSNGHNGYIDVRASGSPLIDYSGVATETLSFLPRGSVITEEGSSVVDSLSISQSAVAGADWLSWSHMLQLSSLLGVDVDVPDAVEAIHQTLPTSAIQALTACGSVLNHDQDHDTNDTADGDLCRFWGVKQHARAIASAESPLAITHTFETSPGTPAMVWGTWETPTIPGNTTAYSMPMLQYQGATDDCDLTALMVDEVTIAPGNPDEYQWSLIDGQILPTTWANRVSVNTIYSHTVTAGIQPDSFDQAPLATIDGNGNSVIAPVSLSAHNTPQTDTFVAPRYPIGNPINYVKSTVVKAIQEGTSLPWEVTYTNGSETTLANLNPDLTVAYYHLPVEVRCGFYFGNTGGMVRGRNIVHTYEFRLSAFGMHALSNPAYDAIHQELTDDSNALSFDVLGVFQPVHGDELTVELQDSTVESCATLVYVSSTTNITGAATASHMNNTAYWGVGYSTADWRTMDFVPAIAPGAVSGTSLALSYRDVMDAGERGQGRWTEVTFDASITPSATLLRSLATYDNFAYVGMGNVPLEDYAFEFGYGYILNNGAFANVHLGTLGDLDDLTDVVYNPVGHNVDTFAASWAPDNNGVTGNFLVSWTAPVAMTAVSAMLPNALSLTYIISDQPEHRMNYRPWRNIVDAAVFKEQKLLFIPTHERLDFNGGILGLPAYGQSVPFRFHQLYNAGFAEQFILEKPSSRTRMVDPANRGMLTFSKVALLDPDTGRHMLSELTRTLNSDYLSKATVYGQSVGGSSVYTRSLIRDVQLGRQTRRMQG